MATVGEIFDYLAQTAPLYLAESYDNPGLLAGSRLAAVTRAVVALDITTPVCEEAARAGAQLIISHHPIIFRPVRAVLCEGATAPLWQLIRRGLAAICMHTNLDAASGGVNDTLCSALGLKSQGVLLVRGAKRLKKVAVYAPRTHAETVRLAMAQAGAGGIGRYDSCAFEAQGTGYFRPLEGSQPFIGTTGKIERVDEVKIEAVCLPGQVGAVLKAVCAAHPYEEPAIDVYDIDGDAYGIGRLARLDSPRELSDFAREAVAKLGSRGAQVAAAGRAVRQVAVCGGAWDGDLTEAAIIRGADTLLTGEIKHSDMLAAAENGLNVIAAGHYATEQVVCPLLAERLAEAFPQVRFELSGACTDPVDYIVKAE